MAKTRRNNIVLLKRITCKRIQLIAMHYHIMQQ